MIPRKKTEYRREKQTVADHIICGLIQFLRFFADLLFKNRYGHRAVFIETIAAIPGMVGGALLHLRCLRKIKDDEGWIRKLVDEAENERMHLMTFIHIAKPTWFERVLIYVVQVGFVLFYTTFYICSSRLAHRFVGYLEEEAIQSYTDYLAEIDAGHIPNTPAPQIAIDYWQLPKSATLRDLVIAIREDECHHRDVNHYRANLLTKKS